MKILKIATLIFMISILVTLILPILSVASAGVESTKVKPGEIIIGLKDVSIESFRNVLKGEGASIKREIPQLNAIIAKVAHGNENSFIQRFKARADVAFVEQNGIYEVTLTPNDPSWPSQWNMPMIKANNAWDTYQGSKEITIAIIDTGVNYLHSDLAANYQIGGYDWVNSDFDPMDDHSHGTHCAGISAAVLNNAVGVAGLVQSKIWAEKVLNSGGSGGWDDIASGIIHATDAGVDVISMSLGGYGYSSLIDNACAYAASKGVVIVAAAGNDQRNIDTFPFYPASLSSVIAVSATNSADSFDSSYSNYGNAIEVSAPGTSIYSTILGNAYGYKTGTSMAAPHVAGLAALIWSYKPQLTSGQVRNELTTAVDDKGTPGKDIFYGWGRINAQKTIASPETYQYKFSLGSYPDNVYVNVTSQGGGMLINGKVNVTAPNPNYPAPVLGWGAGNSFYMIFDFRKTSSSYDTAILVGTISTASGNLYRTTDGNSWVGPMAISLVPFTEATQDSGPNLAEAVEPQAIQYVEGFNPTGTVVPSSAFTGGWYGIEYTPSVSYPLKKVEIMTGDKTGPVIVQLRPDNGSGYPSNTVLREVTYTMSSTVSWQGAEFPTSIQLNAGTTYWLVIQPVALSRFSMATSGTLYAHTWDNFGTGTGWDFKGALFPWMMRFYKEVQPYFNYHFTVSPFADKAYVNVASAPGGMVINGLANVTGNSLGYPATILGFASGNDFYMPFDYRTNIGSGAFELGLLVGKVSTASGNLYRTQDGISWFGPTAVSLVPFAEVTPEKGLPASTP